MSVTTQDGDVLSSKRVDEDRFEFEIPSSWGQGRTVFGGLVMGALTRAMRARVSQPERALRSFSAELLAPPSLGPARIVTRVVRSSASVTAVRAELSQDEGVLTQATALFASARPVEDRFSALTPPATPAWGDVPVLAIGETGFAPEFTQHFEYRPLHGAPYMEERPAPTTTGWVRPLTGLSVRDEALAVAWIDAWWLAVMVGLSRPRPAATLGFSFALHGDVRALAPDEPLLHHGRALLLGDGYATETRELWTPEGELFAWNQQLVCVIK